MEIIFLIKGLLIGFAMAVPIGPVGIMCIRKTLAEGHSRGFIIGLGAATADAIYGSMAAFGLTFISDVVLAQKFWLRLIGGGVLIFLGIRTYLAKPKDPIVPYTSGPFASFFSAFFLVLTNPMTIFAFIAVFAAVGLGHKVDVLSACILVVGVFTGSGLWFLTLSYLATSFRKKLDSAGLRWVNKIAGMLIVISGIAAFISLTTWFD
ncbi:MAG: LysE family transporter [Bacteroidetes bacterium]|nr:LysE family transporter [Bacteroidota bacterium]